MKVTLISDTGFGKKGGSLLAAELTHSLNQNYLDNESLKISLPSRIYSSGLERVLRKIPILRGFFFGSLKRKLIKRIQKHKSDIIHFHIGGDPRLAYLLSPIQKELEIPLVVTIHSRMALCSTNWGVKLPELEPCLETERTLIRCWKCTVSKAKMAKESSYKSGMGAIRTVYNSFAYKILLKQADAVICPSRTFGQMLQKSIGVKPYFIPNPLPISLFEANPEYGGDGSVVFLGRLIYGKGVPLLPELAKKMDKTSVHIAGWGKLESFVKRIDLNNISCHGFVTGKEKRKLIKGRSVVIVPSLLAELYPYVIPEALSLGKPVVAFNHGGPKEQINDSGGGLLAKPFDVDDFAEKIKILIDNPSKTENFGEKGRKWTEKNLHPHKYASSLEKVYKNAIHLSSK